MNVKKINTTIKLLMISDIFVITGFGLVQPILAIYINDNLIGGSIFTAGLASTLFFLTKASVQLPFSRHVDSHDDQNDLRWLIIGSLLVTCTPIIYIFAVSIYHIYIAQIIYGIGAGLAYPTWLGLWSTHLDKTHESFEWSLYSTLTALGSAVAVAVGAAVAEYAGFTFTFILVGIFSLLGCFILFRLKKKLPRAPMNSHT